MKKLILLIIGISLFTSCSKNTDSQVYEEPFGPHVSIYQNYDDRLDYVGIITITIDGTETKHKFNANMNMWGEWLPVGYSGENVGENIVYVIYYNDNPETSNLSIIAHPNGKIEVIETYERGQFLDYSKTTRTFFYENGVLINRTEIKEDGRDTKA